MAAFTTFDWFLIVVVLLSTLAAFFRGFIKVLFSICGLVLGLVAAAWYYGVLAVRLTLLPTPAAQQIVAFLLIFAVVVIAFTVVAGVLRRAVSAVGLGLFDRVLGALLGFARGVLVGVVCMMAFAVLTPNWSPLKNSQLAPYFLAGAHAVSFIVPAQLQQQVAAGAGHLLQKGSGLFEPHTLTKSK